MADAPLTGSNRHANYWQAQGIIHRTLSHFENALADKNAQAQRRAFFRLASYHGRTLHIFGTAQQSRNDALAQATLHNLMALHRALHHMHQSDPSVIPMPTVLPATERKRFLRDLIVRVLQESSRALTHEELSARVTRLDMLGRATPSEVAQYVQELVHEKYVLHEAGAFSRSSRPYTGLDWNLLSLRALLGDDLHRRFEEIGYYELTDVDDRANDFMLHYTSMTGFVELDSARLFVEAARTILTTQQCQSTDTRKDFL